MEAAQTPLGVQEDIRGNLYLPREVAIPSVDDQRYDKADEFIRAQGLKLNIKEEIEQKERLENQLNAALDYLQD